MTRSLTPLWAALALYLVLTCALIRVVPFNGAPDESAHAQYVEALVSTHALPVFAGQSPPLAGYEFHQPPLFYLLAAPLWAVAGSGAGVYAARALSLAFGLLTIGIVWQTARLVFGRESRAPAFCVLGAALSPLHEGIGASINNDALAGFWAACLFALVARAWTIGATRRLVVLTGVVAGLGALTKLTALPLGVWALVCLGLALRKQGHRPLIALLPALALALLVAAPMLIRNQNLYGDPFAYGLFSRAASVAPGWAQFSQGGASFFFYARAMCWQILGTAWGFFGGPNTLIQTTHTLSPDGPKMPGPLWLLPLLAVVFVPLGGVWKWKTRGSSASPLVTSWGAGVSLVVLLWINFALAHFAGGQARYLHGALLPLTLLVGGGLSASRRAGTLAAALLGLVMIGLSLANIFVWKTLV